MSFPRYPKYKASGVEWLGEVPEHWAVVPLKHLVRLRSGGTPSKENLSYWNGNVPWASSKDLKREALNDTIDHISNQALLDGAAELVEVGSVLVVVRGMILLHTFPVVRTLVPMAINQDLKALTAGERLGSEFLAWMLRGTSNETLNRLDEAGHGTKVLRIDTWTAMLLPLPPLPEQRAIAAFLDRETGKIDGLVAEQERLIELLKEKRQAVISHAVTKGLDPSVPMKDSGIEWLGEVPAHWRVTRCGRYVSTLSGFAFPSMGFSQDESHHRLLRGINVAVGRLRWDEPVYWQRTEADDLDAYELHSGDLVIGMDRPLIGEGVRVARISADDLPCLLLQRVACLRAHPELFTVYLERLLSSQLFVDYFLPETTGVSVPHISPQTIANFVIAVPPLPEQHAIAAYLDETTAKLDALVAEAERAIELLKERRTALISAAVTGQIDVRGLAEAG